MGDGHETELLAPRVSPVRCWPLLVYSPRKVELFAQLEVVVPALDDLLAAIDLHRLHGFSLWDALVVRAALISRCRVLYTEDLQHGQRIDGLEVVNPFS